MTNPEQIRQELDSLNAQITELGGDQDELFAQTGANADGAENSEDTAAALTNAQENQAVLEMLYAKRRRLHDQLG